MKKVYVGCALNQTTDQFQEMVRSFKSTLTVSHEVLEFKGIGDDSPEEVSDFDLGCVRACDVFIALCDQPSTGLGIEIGLSNQLQKPALLVAQSDTVSKMVRGNHTQNPNCSFRVYSDLEDLLHQTKEFITNN